jgi:hypothetical protein
MTSRRLLSRPRVIGFVVGNRYPLATVVQGSLDLFTVFVWLLADPSASLAVRMLVCHCRCSVPREVQNDNAVAVPRLASARGARAAVR